MRSTFLPYCVPSIGDEEIEEVLDTLRSGWLTTGPKVRRFEEQFAAYTGASHAIAVNSCTAGLHLALAANNIGPGDEVIVPTMTFCATANVVCHLGATPVLVDVDHTGHITAETIDQAITPRTKAVIPVHYAGEACDLDPIAEVAKRRGLVIVEDAAHAVGTRYRGRPIGSGENVTAFSFYATKNMTTGEGGMVTTNDSNLADRIRMLVLHGMSHNAWSRYTRSGSWEYQVLEPGYKYNMGEIQGALGLQQLKKLDSFLDRRRWIASRYEAELSSVPGLELPRALPDRGHIYHLYPVRVIQSVSGIGRDQFIERLRDANIGTSVHFIPLHRHPAYQVEFQYRNDMFPIAEWMFQGLVSLPLYPAMSDQDVDDVISAVRNAMGVRSARAGAADAMEWNPT